MNESNSNRPSNRVTIFDVASACGISYGTVSRVINNDPHVHPTTRARVIEAIDRLGYVINRQARSLAGGKTHLVGVLVPDLGTAYIGQIIYGIDSILSQTDFNMVVYTTHRTASKEANYVTDLAEGMVDGLLLVLPRSPIDYTDSLTRRKLPFVLIDHQGTGKDCPAVGATNWQGGYDATEYLIRLGHKRIGFITGSMDIVCSTDRLNGYRAALQAFNIPICDELIQPGSFVQPNGYTGGNILFNLSEPPTAIFASNDVMAMGVMDAARNRGLRIPEDISVVGFDDIAQSAYIHPALTTVNQPLEKMGQVAIQMLVDMLQNTAMAGSRIELPTHLVIRESCRALETT